jgi:hypothetical protein
VDYIKDIFIFYRSNFIKDILFLFYRRMITLANPENEQRGYFESSVLKVIIKQYPMYFV